MTGWKILDNGRLAIKQQQGLYAGVWFYKDDEDTKTKRNTAFNQFNLAGLPANVAWAKAFSQYPREEVPVELIPQEQ